MKYTKQNIQKKRQILSSEKFVEILRFLSFFLNMLLSSPLP